LHVCGRFTTENTEGTEEKKRDSLNERRRETRLRSFDPAKDAGSWDDSAIFVRVPNFGARGEFEWAYLDY